MPLGEKVLYNDLLSAIALAISSGVRSEAINLSANLLIFCPGSACASTFAINCALSLAISSLVFATPPNGNSCCTGNCSATSPATLGATASSTFGATVSAFVNAPRTACPAVVNPFLPTPIIAPAVGVKADAAKVDTGYSAISRCLCALNSSTALSPAIFLAASS